jgi:hypothetical protein
VLTDTASSSPKPVAQESAMPLLQVSSCLSDPHDHGLGVLLPHLAGAVVEKAELAGARLCVWARARAVDQHR